MRRTSFIIWKEFLELRQNLRLLPVIIVAPLIQLFMFGYAATTDVRNVPIVVADGDRSQGSRDLVERFEASRYFTIRDVVTTAREIDPYLERGGAKLALVIPAGYGERVEEGAARVQIVADGSDSNSTTVAMGYATG